MPPIPTCRHGRDDTTCPMCRLLSHLDALALSPSVPRCNSCGSVSRHWEGCPGKNKKRTVRPDGRDEPNAARWRQLRLGGRLE